MVPASLGGPFEDSFWFRTNCVLRFESRHSQVLNLLGDANSLLRHRIRAAWPGRHALAAQPAVSEPGLDDAIYQARTDPVWRAAWRVTDAEIAMVQREVNDHHARLLVVTLANGIQDDPDPVAREHYRHFVGAEDLFQPDDQIKGLAGAGRFRGAEPGSANAEIRRDSSRILAWLLQHEARYRSLER